MSGRYDLHNLKVEEYTTPSPITVAKDTSVNEILGIMGENSVRHIPVVEGGKAVGILSERELKVILSLGQAESLVAHDIMTPEPYCVASDTPLETVALQMSARKIGSAIVCNKRGEITGIFTSTDALNALIEVLRGEVYA
jgi:acetoin utilization protein AcuB